MGERRIVGCDELEVGIGASRAVAMLAVTVAMAMQKLLHNIAIPIKQTTTIVLRDKTSSTAG